MVNLLAVSYAILGLPTAIIIARAGHERLAILQFSLGFAGALYLVTQAIMKWLA